MRWASSRCSGPLTLAIVIFLVLFVVIAIVLHRSALGRLVYVMGNSLETARYSGVRVKPVKLVLFVASGVVAALAGLLYAARLGSVRGDIAQGFELDIITIVLLGGVSIFGGVGQSDRGRSLDPRSSSTFATAWVWPTSRATPRPA